MDVYNGSFVAREKVADMTSSSQLSSVGERGRPLKSKMSLYTQTMYVHVTAMAAHTHSKLDRNTHTCTCVKDMAGDRGWWSNSCDAPERNDYTCTLCFEMCVKMGLTRTDVGFI